jgi:hypothetical protein
MPRLHAAARRRTCNGRKRGEPVKRSEETDAALADFERRAALLAEVVDYVTFDSSALIMPKPRQIAMLSVRFDADRTRW